MRFIRFLTVLSVITFMTGFYTADGVDTEGSLMAVVAEEKKQESRTKPRRHSVQQAAAEFDMVWILYEVFQVGHFIYLLYLVTVFFS